ncbi:MAG TPA: alpha-galactosidase [Candidatus Eisenbergiella merdipullorum]|uniref:Alpha-galactosidase n=1 Tax=Candidatus Eisenbergiella merdipullorum TaxID=2838553 RepID=A0A9D2I6F1_9FIRM|nr:alpha-galactosidase [Candidatus Eisenbergiella merdipullorum]
MIFQLENVEIIVNRQKTGQRKLKAERTEETVFEALEEGIAGRLEMERKESCALGRIRVSLKNEPFRENDNLASVDPVTVCMVLKEQPVRMTALYLHRDWWTRPAFVEKWEELPERTQCVYLKYEDRYGCLLLPAGRDAKTMAGGGREGWLCLNLTAYRGGLSQIEEPVFFYAEGGTVYEAVHACAMAAAEETGALTREQKTYPAVFEELGWCSWDAFYTDISEDKVRAKARELSEKKIPVRWMLLDDGWQSVREQRMYDLMPEKDKFPEGFSGMIADIKADTAVKHVGVWHALGGYWGGIEPGSRAHHQEEENLYQTETGKLLPWPDARKGYGFYRDWYELLRREGIDFVKVDGQSAIKNYYENEIPVCRAARETHKALEGAAAAYMGGNLINCMGMGMENILGRQGSGLSRNSDDFVPDNPDGFTEHLLQNAYNAVYHDEFYYCDWDMFWTFHPDAKKHALLRAVSGGPVYFSDRIGDTDPEAVKPLVTKDGRILRMSRTAKPAQDCLFSDPTKGGLIRLTNLADIGNSEQKGGAIAVYNLSGKEAEGWISPSDIYDLPAGSYYCYDQDEGTGQVLAYEEKLPIRLAPDGYALYLLVPVTENGAVVGLTDKYISFLAAKELQEMENGFWAVMEENGTFAFYSSKKVECCMVNGKDMTLRLKEQDGLYRIEDAAEGSMLVVVTFQA